MRTVCLILFLLALSVACWLQSNRPQHGLIADHADQPPRIEQMAWVTANDGAQLGDSLPVRFTGTLYLPSAQTLTFRTPEEVGAKLVVGNQTIFERAAASTPTDRPTSDEASLALDAGLHPLQLSISAPLDPNRYFQAGLVWKTWLGWRLLPARFLYPQAPTLSEAQADWQRERSTSWLFGLAALCAIVLARGWLWRSSARKRDLREVGTTFFLKEHAPAHLPEVGWPTLLTLLGLSVLALLIRWRVLSELSAHPTLDLLSIGSDQRGYYQGPALDFLRGLWPGEGAFFAKPGYTFLVGWLYSLVGPSMWAVKAVQMAVGAATILLVFDLTRRIFSINAAWAAAVLWLCFPQPIFYEAQLLTHGLEPLLGFLLLWLWLRVVSDPAWGWLMLCGGTLGASALIRPSFLFLVPVLAATLLWQKGWRWIESFAHVGLVALTALAVIAPVTWHNYQASGQLQLISSEGDVTLYMGNHRDSSGFEWKLGPESTFEATSMLVALGKTTYTAQTLAEITNDPARFARLMARKTLLLLSDFEMPNNVDFVQEGLALSPTLAMLPLSFGLLMALGVTGMVLVVGHDSGVTVEPSRQSRDLRVWGTRILFCYLIVNALTVVVFLTLSRLKVPLYPALILFGGWAIAASIDLIRQRQWRWLLLTLAILVSTRLLFANTITLADTVMKPPVEPALPDYAQAHTAPIGSALTLLGHSFLPAVRPGEPVMVTLYWQSQQPIPADWMGTVQVLDSANNVIAQADHEIGAATYPRYFTSQWSPGEVVRDQYLLKIPNDAQAPIAPMLLVAAYESQTGTRAGETQIGPLAITRAEPLTVPSDAIVLGARIGNATLAAYRIQTAENRLNLTLYWRAEAPMNEDAIVFVHLLDGSQQRIGGEDIRPRHGSYSTLAWQVNEGIIDEHLIPLPAGIVINELQLAVGLYNASTQERLPTLDSQGREIGERMVRLGKMTRQAGI